MNAGQFQGDNDCRVCGGVVDYVHHDKKGVRYTWRACFECKTVHPIFKRENGEITAYIRCLEQKVPTEEVRGIMVESGQSTEEASGEGATPKAKGKVEAIKDLLLEGHSRKQIAKMKYDPTGETFNSGSIRIAASDLKKEGLWDPDDEKGDNLPAVPPGSTNGRHMTTYAKGAPPEAIIESFTIPTIGAPGFEQGIKFGMNALVMAVRVMQELANVGAQQAKPLISLSREMRAGEEAAAKSAAQEAVAGAGKEFFGIMSPYLDKIDSLGAPVPVISTGNEDNPMMSMMVRAMEPMFKGAMDGMVKKLMPGAPIDKTPSSWTRERK